MHIKIKEQFNPDTDRFTSTYVDQVNSYITSPDFSEILKEFVNTDNIELLPLSGGITSVVYRTLGLEEDLVLKFSNKYNIYNDFVGLQVAYKNNILVPKPLIAQTISDDFCFSITQFINAPLLSSLSDEPDNYLKYIYEFGKAVKQLNSIQGLGYGAIDPITLNGVSLEPESLNINYVTNENREYFETQEIFTQQESQELFSLLHTYKYNGKGFLIHRDARNENCLWLNMPILFDFNAKFGDPLYDLANYKQKVLLRGQTDVWDAFLNGYGKDIDYKRLDLIVGCILYNKAVSWHKRSLEKKYTYAIKFLKSLIN